MSNDRSRHLFQITASRVKKGDEMGGGYLNTCKHRDASVADEDAWKFEVVPIMLDIDDPESLFGESDCAMWGKEADKLMEMGALQEDVAALRMAALYDIWSVVYERPEEPTEYDMGVEFVGWAKWDRVIGFAGATSRT
jgi:hypothetical protein